MDISITTFLQYSHFKMCQLEKILKSGWNFQSNYEANISIIIYLAAFDKMAVHNQQLYVKLQLIRCHFRHQIDRYQLEMINIILPASG